MNEELKQALQVFATDMIQKIQTGVDQGTAFVSSQAPLIMQEIIIRGIIFSAVGIAVGIVLAVITCLAVRGMVRLAKDEDSDWYALVAAAVLFGGGGAFALICYNTVSLFSRIFAPRLYILEQLKALFLQ